LGAISRRIKRRPFGQSGLIFLGQLSFGSEPKTETSAIYYEGVSKKCALSAECFAPKIPSGMLRDIWRQQDVQMSCAVSIAFEAPLVASPNQAMRAIQVSRKKLYELINTGELKSYKEGKSRRITIKSINDYIERRLAAEAVRRGRAASYGDDQSRP
jgi:excisionase family DNA binding protein